MGDLDLNCDMESDVKSDAKSNCKDEHPHESLADIFTMVVFVWLRQSLFSLKM